MTDKDWREVVGLPPLGTPAEELLKAMRRLYNGKNDVVQMGAISAVDFVKALGRLIDERVEAALAAREANR